MIERYTSKEMGAIWSDQAKMDAWKDVEIAACEGWTEQGMIPPDDMAKIRQGTFTLERVAEIEKVTDHDTASFVQALGESLGPESRWVHHGLTSSDVVDTGLALQLVRASDLPHRGCPTGSSPSWSGRLWPTRTRQLSAARTASTPSRRPSGSSC